MLSVLGHRSGHTSRSLQSRQQGAGATKPVQSLIRQVLIMVPSKKSCDHKANVSADQNAGQQGYNYVNHSATFLTQAVISQYPLAVANTHRIPLILQIITSSLHFALIMAS